MHANQPAAQGRPMGRIKMMTSRTFFGFRGDDGHEWFFHRNHLQHRRDWKLLGVEQRVRFRIGRNERGPCVVDVAIETDSI